MTSIENTQMLDEIEPQPLRDLLLTGLVTAASTLSALLLLPYLLPGLTLSMTGADPKVFWYLSRGSAIASYGLLWLSMVFGVLLTNKLAQLWPGASLAYEVHQFVSLLGLAFGLLHGLLLMGDHYIQYSLAQVLTPFASVDYRPGWVGLGQLGFYCWAIIVGSFYVRKRIGRKAWRWIHLTSFICFLLALVHGLASGTDTSTATAQLYYWASGGILLFLIVYRVLGTVMKNQVAPAR